MHLPIHAQTRQPSAVPPAAHHLHPTSQGASRFEPTKEAAPLDPLKTAALANGGFASDKSQAGTGKSSSQLEELRGISREKNELPLPWLGSLSPFAEQLAGPWSDGGRLTHLHIIPDGKFLPQYSRLLRCHITARPRGQEQVQLVTGLVRRRRLSFYYLFPFNTVSRKCRRGSLKITRTS